MFYSVLFQNYDQYKNTNEQQVLPKPYFNDLGLDLVLDSVIESKNKFKLEEYYFKPLHNVNIISYRQDVMRELENLKLRKIMIEFSNEGYLINLKMKEVRKELSSKNDGSNNFLVRGHMLDYAERYCYAVKETKKKLSGMTLLSEGILGFKTYINHYVETENFKLLTAAVNDLRKEFSNLKYNMLIDGGTIKIRKYDNQVDYAKKIESTFQKFSQKDSKDYRHDLSEKPKAEHVEEGVLNVLSKVYKESFNKLSDFCSEFINFNGETINRFSQELQFYLSWLDYIKDLKENSLQFNYPIFTTNPDQIFAYDSFDLALSNKIKNEVVRNNFMLQGSERIVVVTGPNQGGKTTYAKMIGQIHYLGSLGLCVPGTSSSLYLFDSLYTHFSTEEDLSTQSGKLKDDLVRLREIITQASNKSLIIINEIFSSTTTKDALFLGRHMMNQLIDLQSPTVIVTFLDELALHSEKVVSMMSTVSNNDPTKRTYKVVRKAPDGSAYAIHIAEKHNLTYKKLLRRLEK